MTNELSLLPSLATRCLRSSRLIQIQMIQWFSKSPRVPRIRTRGTREKVYRFICIICICITQNKKKTYIKEKERPIQMEYGIKKQSLQVYHAKLSAICFATQFILYIFAMKIQQLIDNYNSSNSR